MYDINLIKRDSLQILTDSKDIAPYVVIAQPRRDLQETPAQNLNGYNTHIDLRGFSHGFVEIGGEKVDVARNYLMEQVLESGAKYMLFVGEDTVLPYDGFLALHRTCEDNPNSCAVGVYYMKGSTAPMIMIKEGSWVYPANTKRGNVFPIWMAGMDAMLIPISILKEMKEKEPENPFTCIVNNIEVEGQNIEFIGEDNYFYNRLHNNNYQVLCNTDFQCLHVDLATGKYSASQDVDLNDYFTNFPITDKIVPSDNLYLQKRWHDRLPKGSLTSIPEAGQIKAEFDELLKISKGKDLILEIGTDKGGTLYKFLQEASDDAEIVSVDMDDKITKTGIIDYEMVNLWKKPNQKVHLLNMDSHKQETLEEVIKILGNRKFDLTFVDADHSYDGVKMDYLMYKDISKVMAFHDISPTHFHHVDVKKFWDELEGNKKEFIQNPPQSWGGIGVLFIES